jgi:4-hydroxy-tetrahydrodipicolinate synthase
MVNTGLAGDFVKANQLHEKLNPIYSPLYQDGNPAGIKATLNIMGICKNILRPPLVGVTDETYNNLKRFINH